MDAVEVAHKADELRDANREWLRDTDNAVSVLGRQLRPHPVE